MSRNNDVFKVLVTTGNQDLLTAGGSVDSLALGQIGIFDAQSNISVDETSVPPRSVYFAVAVDRNGDGLKDDIEVSAAQHIQTKNVKELSFRPHTPGQNLVLDVVDYADAECDSDYTLKIEIRDQEIYRLQGHNQFTKTFSVRTDCCVGTEVSQDANKLTKLLRDAINLDETGMFSADSVTRQAVTTATHGVAGNLAEGDVITDADIDDLIAYNIANPSTPVYTDIRITFSSLDVQTFCSVNLKYFKPRQVFAIASVLEDFKCLGAAVETQTAMAFEEGKGYDVKQKEYKSQSNVGGPYVTSDVTGVARNIKYFADQEENYDQTIVEYEFASKSGWKDYLASASTIIATPATSTVTRNALIAAMDVIFAGLGFDELTSDAAAADVNPAVLEPTEDKGLDDDGLA